MATEEYDQDDQRGGTPQVQLEIGDGASDEKPSGSNIASIVAGGGFGAVFLSVVDWFTCDPPTRRLWYSVAPTAGILVSSAAKFLYVESIEGLTRLHTERALRIADKEIDRLSKTQNLNSACKKQLTQQLIGFKQELEAKRLKGIYTAYSRLTKLLDKSKTASLKPRNKGRSGTRSAGR